MTTTPNTPTGAKPTHTMRAAWVNHILGLEHGPLVQMELECPAELGRKDAVVFAQMDPLTARSIAADLLASAARAEYEADLWRGCEAHGLDTDAIGPLIHLVRLGEAAAQGIEIL